MKRSKMIGGVNRFVIDFTLLNIGGNSFLFYIEHIFYGMEYK